MAIKCNENVTESAYGLNIQFMMKLFVFPWAFPCWCQHFSSTLSLSLLFFLRWCIRKQIENGGVKVTNIVGGMVTLMATVSYVSMAPLVLSLASL